MLDFEIRSKKLVRKYSRSTSLAEDVEHNRKAQRPFQETAERSTLSFCKGYARLMGQSLIQKRIKHELQARASEGLN
jgi:hypothetical protein